MKKSGVWFLGALFAIGTYWSYSRGGIDFAVFHHAWRLVLEGRGGDIYTNSPDRYLYAPGFAWLLAPLGFLPQPAALALWCGLKAFALGSVIRFYAKYYSEKSSLSFPIALSIAAFAVCVMSRPLLIEIQYGQINLLILAVAVWALSEHFKKEEGQPWRESLSWFFLGILAFSKIFPSPLLMIPWVRKETASGARLKREQIAAISGVLITLVAPVTTLGFRGALQMIFAWRAALLEKGLPYESHNQSFVACLHHYFTTDPTHIISLGSQWVVLGKDILSLEVISMLSLAWTLISLGVLIGWILKSPIRDPLRWIAVAIALIFVPSHLIWKPYFVFGIPGAMVLAFSSQYWLLGIAFVLINLTGFDMIGGFLAGHLEAASLFLWVHLLLVLFLMKMRDLPKTNSKSFKQL
jgi:hypothetical protein